MRPEENPHRLALPKTMQFFPCPQVAWPGLPLLEILPVQMVSLALADLSGKEAGLFSHSSKVTETE